MASSLRVNSIIPSSGTNVAIGTAGGTITYNANVSGVSTFSSGIIVSTGTTAAPSISPSGDSNTGIFFPSPDTVAIGEGGIEVLRVNSSGNIGISTEIPTAKLDIIGGGSRQLQVTGTESDIWLRSTGSGTTWRILGSSGNSTHRFRIYDETNSVERFGIDSSGRIQMPFQPAFMVRGDETGSKASNSKFAFNSSGSDSKVTFDRLGNWSNDNDRFTAPVAGVYQFYFGLYRQSATSTIFSVAPRVNNNQLSIGDTLIFFTAATGESANSDDGMYGTFTLNLQANDYVELFMRGGAPTITIYAGHTFFGGHLIG